MPSFCCGSNPNEACGWPPGTVRAFIAIFIITLTFLTAVVSVILLIVNYQQYTIAVGLLGTMFSVISAVVGYYFGTKAADTANKLVADSQRQIIQSKEAELSRMMEPRQLRMNSHFQNNRDTVIEMEPPKFGTRRTSQSAL